VEIKKSMFGKCKLEVAMKLQPSSCGAQNGFILQLKGKILEDEKVIQML